MHFARKKVDGGSHPDATGHTEIPVVLVDPLFLFRAAKGDEKDIGCRRLDACRDLGIVKLMERCMGGGIATGQNQSRIFLLQVFPRCCQ